MAKQKLTVAIAPDSFKGSMSADTAARLIEKGVLAALPDARCIRLPMADGGEGTVSAMVSSTGGRLRRRRVRDPLGRPVSAAFGLSGDGKMAVIEMAAASGLTLLAAGERNPLVTSTFGTGELIRHSLDAGVSTIVIGIGGSATVDGGVGMAQALGVRFVDARGREIGPGGGALNRLAHIDLTGRDARLAGVNILCACDVSNPLTGVRGAARVYGRQKGASATAVKRLDANLRHLAGVIRKDLGVRVCSQPGAGAAGGLGAGLLAFLDAEMCSGVEVVMRAMQFESRIASCDLVITGEGRVDRQTSFGKAPIGVARVAGALGIPVLAICGGVERGFTAVHAGGVQGVMPAAGFGFAQEGHGGRRRQLRDCAEQAARILSIGWRLP